MLEEAEVVSEAEQSLEDFFTNGDKIIFQGLQGRLDKFLTYANQYIEFMETHPLKTHLYDNASSVNEMQNLMEDHIHDVIKEMAVYINKTYHITLDTQAMSRKYEKATVLHYSTILADVLEHLDGESFEEKAIAEMKAKARQDRTQRNISLKRKKITLSHFVEWDGFSSSEYRVAHNTKVKDMFLALSHFTTKSFEMLTTLQDLYSELNSYGYKNSKFEKKRVYPVKTLAVRVFKNGKLEMEFESKEDAKRFANEYLGFVPSN